MTFSRSRNISMATLLALLVLVGSLPTLAMLLLSSGNDRFSAEMQRLEEISALNATFWSAATTFTRIVAKGEGDFDAVLGRLQDAGAILRRVDTRSATNPVGPELTGLLKSLERHIRVFKVATHNYRSEMELDPAADQAHLLEETAYRAFQETNQTLLAVTRRVSTEAHRSHFDMTALFRRLQQLSIAVVCLGLLIGGLTIVRLNRAMTRPVTALIQSAQAIEGGDLETPIRLASADEFGTIAAAFDRMRGHLKCHIENQLHLMEKAQQAAEAEKVKAAELAVAVERAEAANRAKSDFLSNMSHELRTPLNHVIGFTQLVIDESFGELNDTQKEYLGDVLDSSNHLLSLINDILDLAKVEAGKMDLNAEVVYLEPLLESSLFMVKEKALKNQIELETMLVDLPETIVADDRKLKQILYNLLGNAVKFTPSGGRVTLMAKYPAEGDASGNGVGDGQPSVVISVIDTGIGIAADHLRSIFNPFEQVESAADRSFEGTGLGLTLTERMVKLHRGTIWAESDGEGRGSRFSFTIPVAEPHSTTVPQGQRTTSAAA